LKPARRFPDSGSLENDVLLAGYTGESQYGGLVNLKSIYWQGPMRPLKEVHGKVKLEASVRPVAIEMAGVFDKIGQAARGHDGVTLKILQADRAAMKLRVQFDNVEALTPQSDAEKIVRIRPGVIGVRGPMDVVLERLELQGPHGWPCKRIESSYARAEDGKGYMATLTFEPPSTAAQDLTLVLTKAARTVPVEIPFLVRDVQVPRKQ
jgi:hypothetical protein